MKAREIIGGAPGKRTLDVSIAVPAYNEEGNLGRLYDEVTRALLPLRMSWEIIIADDGSNDGTWEKIQALNAADPHVKGIRLSRNFGHQYALFAAMSQAAGKAIISMDADLQHPPALIPKLIEEWRRGSRIVHTVRLEDGNLPLLKRLTSRLYYKLYSVLSGVDIQPGMADFRLLDRAVVESLRGFGEEGLFLRGLVQWVGYPSSRVAFAPLQRFSGTSKYTLRKMLKLAWNGIASFSTVPLHIGIVVGFVTSFLAFLDLVYVIWAKLFTDSVVPGWASEVGIIAILFGILFIMLGVIGEYIGRIFVEVKRRPRYIISDCVGMRAFSPVDIQPAAPEERAMEDMRLF